MTVVSFAAPDLARLSEQLDGGIPIVVPLPSPLPYVVVGADPWAVNGAKGRPREQPVGVRLPSLAAVEPVLDLDRAGVELVRWLCYEERVGVLAPVGLAAPDWVAPAIVDGMAFLAGAWLPELDELMAGRSHLYMSSGNKTASRPAVTAAEAEAFFGDALFVVDGDRLRSSTAEHGSSTMVAVGRDGSLKVARPGINNAAFGADLEAYVADLHRRF